MIIFNLLSLILIKLSSENHVKYKFKKISNPTKTLMENILQNDLEISMYIGTPPQKVNLNLRSKSYAFFIAGSEVKLNLTKFNETKSSSYKKLTEKPTKFLNLEYSRGYKISESLLINNKIINDITLVLASELNYFESGALGLKLVYNHEFTDELSFIYQLKKLANFDNYGFYLKYDNDESLKKQILCIKALKLQKEIMLNGLFILIFLNMIIKLYKILLYLILLSLLNLV